MPQTPSLGRVVIAHVAEPAMNNGSIEAPAIITRVFGQHPAGGWIVNLRVLLDAFTTPLHLTSVRLLDEAPEGQTHTCWWPPRV